MKTLVIALLSIAAVAAVLPAAAETPGDAWTAYQVALRPGCVGTDPSIIPVKPGPVVTAAYDHAVQVWDAAGYGRGSNSNFAGIQTPKLALEQCNQGPAGSDGGDGSGGK